MKLYVVNVGVNKSHAPDLRSPIFADDDTFEFVPIPEIAEFATNENVPTYAELRCWTGRRPLAEYVATHRRSDRAHADPEFATFTYGDDASETNNIRSPELRRVVQGDELWFLARLWTYDESRSNEPWTGADAQYFIGVFVVEENKLIPSRTPLDRIDAPLGKWIRERASENADYRWLLAGGASFPSRIITGDRQTSRRFERALPVTTELAGLIYRGTHTAATDGYQGRDGKARQLNALLTFKRRGSGLLPFDSATRSVRAWLDTERPGDREYVEKLWKLRETCGRSSAKPSSLSAGDARRQAQVEYRLGQNRPGGEGTLEIAITTERADDKGWIAFAPEVRATAQGSTEEEAKANLRALLRRYPDLLDEPREATDRRVELIRL